MDTTPPPVAPPPPAPPTSGRGTLILVLGILSVVCCVILGPVAWIMGKSELEAIAAGRSPARDEGLARAGMILGIIGTALFAFSLIWVFLFGGLSALSALFGQ
jgi:hypothetical protein